MTIAIDAMLLGNRRTGVERSILNLLRALSESGSQRYRAYVPRTFNEPLGAGIDVVKAGAVSQSRLARIAWEQFVLARAAERDGCRLLHAPGYLAPLTSRLPVVLTVYDVMALTHPELCCPANRWNYRVFLPASIRKADAVIVPSRFTKSEVTRTVPTAAGAIHVIPLAVADAIRRVPTEAALVDTRKRLRLPERFVLAVGREEPKKDVVTLLRAFHALKARGGTPCGLVIAGPSGPASRAIDRELLSLGLQQDVIRCGEVTDGDLLNLYHLAEVFAFPSLYEGFGLPPLEAMACGAPVVCSTAGALPEVVGEAALTTPPGDATALAHALGRVLSDDPLRADLVRKGRQQAARTSWRDVAEHTDAVYQHVLSTRSTVT